MVAALVLTCFLILRNHHPSSSIASLPRNSPKPTGTYADSKSRQEQPPLNEPQASKNDDGSKANTEPKMWEGDSGMRVALAKKPMQQISLSKLQAQPLRKQLAYAFPYDPKSKFPAYIWQTWKHSPSSQKFEEDFRPPEASWTALHPSFVHEVITDSVAVHLIRHLYASVPEVVEAYSALPHAVMKADFFRYLILLARGGIYTEIDTWALKSAVDWVPLEVPRTSFGLVIGIEADPQRDDWHDWYSRRIQFCQWTIQSKPGHPVLVDAVASITEETLRRKAAGELVFKDLNGEVEFTGPALWTDLVFRFFNNPEFFDMSTSQGNITWRHFTGMKAARKVGDVVVLPITSFSPGVGQMGAGEDDDPMAFVKHTFQSTWLAAECHPS